MCRTYGAGAEAYVRACYRTGQAGRRVPAATAAWDGEHLILDAAAKAARVVGVMQHYRIPPNTAAEVWMDAVRRYAPLNDPAPQPLADGVYLSFHFAKPTPGLTERMATFGWALVPHVEGLEPPPLRANATRGRRGPRAVQWALLVVFDAEPTVETLAQLIGAADDDPPRRQFYASAAGRWVYHGWRDRGWSRDGWAALWGHIARLGGRAHQPGDDPGPVRPFVAEDAHDDGERADRAGGRHILSDGAAVDAAHV